MSQLPEHNVTGIDYEARSHLSYGGPPLVDFHSHLTRTRPTDPKDGPLPTGGPDASLEQAEMMFAVAREFGVRRIATMCPPDDIPPLRERFGEDLVFIGSIAKKLDEPAQAAYELYDQFVRHGAQLLKFWSAPRGRDRGLFVDAPWRIEVARQAVKAGIRVIMVHVGDPDRWFETTYADATKFGTKSEQYERWARVVEAFPEITWVGAHMGGDPEHPDHLEELLERFPNVCFDTSATKWQVREVSPRAEAARALIEHYPNRFIFGSDLVTRHHLSREHYVSRYWCQRTLWESRWEGRSPIADPDYVHSIGEPATPLLRGIGLSQETLRQVYSGNARKLLGLPLDDPA